MAEVWASALGRVEHAFASYVVIEVSRGDIRLQIASETRNGLT